MTKEREALKLALDALENIYYGDTRIVQYKVIQSVRNVLAQLEQEPLEYWNAVEGWVKIDEVRKHFETVSCGTIYKTAGEGRVPLYTAPPKREWVGLSKKQIKKLGDTPTLYSDYEAGRSSFEYLCPYKFVADVEAKLKELNHD